MKLVRKLGKGVGKVIKPLVNFPAWMGWKQIKSSGKTISDATKVLMESTKATRQETFEQAVARLHLTDQNLTQRMKVFKGMALLYATVGIGLFCYVIYMIIGGHFAAAFLSFVLTVLAGTLSLRQHFWYYQMKKQKLGCTLKEWFNDTFRGA